jgi:redox-sensitive bicupin YhaK (pirin superfamily)
MIAYQRCDWVGEIALGDIIPAYANGKLEVKAIARRPQQAAAGKRVLSGKPMDEPIVFHYGPLLMNIMDEIQQAVEDYCAGQMVKAVS